MAKTILAVSVLLLLLLFSLGAVAQETTEETNMPDGMFNNGDINVSRSIVDEAYTNMYIATLTVTDDDGATGSDSVAITVTESTIGSWVNPVNATASSEYSSAHAPENAIDDNTATHWFTIGYEGPPCWIQFDLGSVEQVSKVRAIIYHKEIPMTLDVQVSNDAENWETVVANFTITEGGTFVEILFAQTDARYIRLHETGFARMYGQCTEFDVYVGGDDNQPPVAYASANPLMVCIPTEVRFVGAGTDVDGTVVSYEWDFGDGLTSHLREPYHLYENAGIYTATFTVTDDDGATGSTNVTIVVRNNPIVDNGMKAYVWDSNAEAGWHTQANAVAAQWRSQGFNVTQHIAPSPSLIYQTIKDNDITVYWGLGHGSDSYASTGDGYYHASAFGNCLEERGQPLTIGVFQHCGEYDCCNDSYWLQESTQGNLNVVAQRFFGEGWCEDCNITVAGYGVNSLLYHMGRGYTYEDSVEKVRWTHAEGKKLGNRDLRYPQFCGDVNYDMIVNESDIMLLRNHINNSDAYPIHSDWDADVNGDDSVDARDADLLANHVNNSLDYPLNPRGWFINLLPVANASANSTNGTAPLNVAFTGTGTDSDGTIASYEWTFGDGASSTAQNPTHTYTSPGTYTATLTVTDDDGATGSDSVAITVTESTIGSWVNPVNATASSEYSSAHAPENAIDDNTATHWFTIGYEGPPCWIQFDLGSVEQVSKVRAIIYHKEIPMTLDVQVSNDAENWETVVANFTITEGGTFVEILFAQTDARYIRLHETGFARMYGQCTEFDAYVLSCNPTLINFAVIRKDMVVVIGSGFGDDPSDWSDITISHEGIPLELDIVIWDDNRISVLCAAEIGDIATVSVCGTDSCYIVGDNPPKPRRLK